MNRRRPTNKQEVLARLRAAPRNTEGLRAVRRRISKEIAALDRTAVLDLAQHLVELRSSRFVAYELVANHRAAIESITAAEVESLGRGMDEWGDRKSTRLNSSHVS